MSKAQSTLWTNSSNCSSFNGPSGYRHIFSDREVQITFGYTVNENFTLARLRLLPRTFDSARHSRDGREKMILCTNCARRGGKPVIKDAKPRREFR
jgi:hypothetical protein